MLITEKINVKRYTLLSFLLLICSFFLLRDDWDLIIYISISFIAVIISHLMLIYLVGYLFGLAKQEGKKRNSTLKLMTLTFSKMSVLVLIFFVGSSFLGNRVIIPLSLYVFQLIIFVISIKNIKWLR